MLNTWYSERLFSSDYTTIIGTSFTSQLYDDSTEMHQHTLY